jgi:hypothetical protein
MILIRILSQLNFQFKQGHSAFYSEKSDWRFDILFQVFVTRLTLIVKTWHLLKPTFTDKNNLASFRLLINDKEKASHLGNARGCGDLDSFFTVTNRWLLLTACC